MPSDVNPKAWATEWLDRFWNRRDPDAMEELMHPECTFTEMAGGSWEAKGYEPLRRNAELFFSAVPDLQLDFVQLIGDDKFFGWVVHCTGTIRDSTFGVELGGRPFNMLSLASGEIRGPQIIQAYNYVSFNQPRVVWPGWERGELQMLATLAQPADAPTGGRLVGDFIRGQWGGTTGIQVEELLSPDIRITEANAGGYETRGIDNVLRNGAWFRAQMPNAQLSLTRVIAEPGAAAVCFELEGVVVGDALGRAAKVSNAKVRGMLVGSVEAGCLVHAYSHLDLNHVGTELPAP
jgi:hypothetical protein